MNLSNKEILEKANAAVSKGNYEEFLSFCTDDTVWTFIGEQTLTGKEEVRKYMEKAYAEPPKFDVENLIADGDFVTAVGKISMKDEHSKMITYDYCDVWKFKDGKMWELKAFVIAAESTEN
ncbi:ketosteroid isomerase [Chryseobacterium sp. IHB B 17019]|jgi:ketosteroid isomerase-like protein|uniref:nuclear transport factor 2 family protein n=1 Tax=Chryseobacterium sp. IHB B 17019 TaxID=1721091 RepID=UPI0007204E28|nr:nuclear transport factor 2 family protein [Chryseobacterium sp. IHB B 17019]ALR29545.1 ketosteroid isomerase [Chryseobacterium sp. IHB B 17019]